MGGGEVLEVTHLITNRGRARILRDVSLAVREKQVVWPVGRSAARPRPALRRARGWGRGAGGTGPGAEAGRGGSAPAPGGRRTAGGCGCGLRCGKDSRSEWSRV